MIPQTASGSPKTSTSGANATSNSLPNSASNKDISPRILTQHELKIKEVEQKIQEIAFRFVTDAMSYGNLLNIRHMVHQLEDKAKTARNISRKDPRYKEYRDLYRKTIEINYNMAAERIISSGKRLESELSYCEAKEILQAIHKLK